MFNFFKKKAPPEPVLPLVADMHSHLLPGLDDGSASLEESMEMIEELVRRGYQRLYTTPHIIHDFYPNSKASILPALQLVQNEIKLRKLDVRLEAAAEYFLDESFIAKLDEGEPLMTFAGNYVLFETPFLNEPVYLRDVIFKMLTAGYKPVFAHPERYQYLFNNWERVEELHDSGVLFQVNLLSFAGHYNRGTMEMAEDLADKGWIHFLGTDCHRMKHLEVIATLEKNKFVRKAMELPLLNHQI